MTSLRFAVAVAYFAGAMAISDNAFAQDQSFLDLVDQCDVLAAHPNDPERMADGVTEDAIVPKLATMTCAAAAKRAPDEPRFAFQFGRALLAAGKQKEAFEQFVIASDRQYAAAYAYLGDAYQFGHGVQADNAKAFASYKKALDGGFDRAKSQLDQLSFDKHIFAFDVLSNLFEARFDQLQQQADEPRAKWSVRAYVFSMTQKLVSECGKVVQPQQIEKLHRFRMGSGWTPEVDASVDVTIKSSIAEYDADAFLKRHGCEGPVSRHIFAMLDQFLAQRSGD